MHKKSYVSIILLKYRNLNIIIPENILFDNSSIENKFQTSNKKCFLAFWERKKYHFASQVKNNDRKFSTFILQVIIYPLHLKFS